jgi:hypothetical protein
MKSKPQPQTDAQKARLYKKELKQLTTAVVWFLGELDSLMKQPSTRERGQQIATLCNDLELKNDSALHFGLDLDWKKLKKLKMGIHSGRQAGDRH